jgi:hypothetical protein
MISKDRGHFHIRLQAAYRNQKGKGSEVVKAAAAISHFLKMKEIPGLINQCTVQWLKGEFNV